MSEHSGGMTEMQSVCLLVVIIGLGVFLIGMIGLVGLVNIISSFSMIIVDKSRQIGILKSLGLKNSQLK